MENKIVTIDGKKYNLREIASDESKQTKVIIKKKEDMNEEEYYIFYLMFFVQILIFALLFLDYIERIS